MSSHILIIAGPTASGKTNLAFEVAKKIPSVIINADSMQVYSNLKILTNVPTEKELKFFNCKLFGSVKAPKISDIKWWLERVNKEISSAISKNLLPIIVGGSGLYISGLEKEFSYIPRINEKIRNKIRAIHHKRGTQFFYKKLQKFDPVTSKSLNENDTHRIIRAIEVKISTGKTINFWKKKKISNNTIKNKILFLVIKQDRNLLYDSINKRFLQMIKKGVIEEIKTFLKSNVPNTHPIYGSIGLKHLKNFIEGNISLDNAINCSQKDSRNYAKRQITWFNRQPKKPIFVKSNEAKQIILDKFKPFI